MNSLELNIAKNIIENMSADEKDSFIHAMTADMRTSYATQSAKEIVLKRLQMGIELISDSEKSKQFSKLVEGLI